MEHQSELFLQMKRQGIKIIANVCSDAKRDLIQHAFTKKFSTLLFMTVLPNFGNNNHNWTLEYGNRNGDQSR